MFKSFVLAMSLVLVGAVTVKATEMDQNIEKVAGQFNVMNDFSGFVRINTKKQLYVEYIAPQAGRPTVVLLNGLTYSTRQWDAMTVFLKKAGLGVVRYDMSGMGQTLLKYKTQYSAYQYTDQVLELDQLLTTLRIAKPYNLVGLSYGGGIAAAYTIQFPTNIKNAILMAPYTVALAKQDDWIKSQIRLTRVMNPFNVYSDDELYDYFLKQICYTTYPLVEPVVLENQYKLEAVFRLTQGIRKFDLIKYVHLFPPHSIHLVIAEKDQYIPQDVLNNFWNAIPILARASLTYVANSEHKMPEAVPEKSASLVDYIVSK